MGYSKLKTYRLSYLFIFICCLTTGCFNIRQADAPQNAGDWTPPNQPEVLISNFTLAVIKLNLVNYERCFVRSGYVFYPEPTVARNNQGAFASWSLQTSELEYIRNLQRVQNMGVPNILMLTNARTNNLSADSLEYIADYALTMYQTDTTYRNYNFKGTINLYMTRNVYNEWAIAAWRDTRSGPDLCWTQLKEKFVGR